MAKLRQVGNSLVVTIPAALAKQYGLRPGDDVEIVPDGEALRVVPMVRLPKHQADPELDHELGARELVRRYHADLSEALAQLERERQARPVDAADAIGAGRPVDRAVIEATRGRGRGGSLHLPAPPPGDGLRPGASPCGSGVPGSRGGLGRDAAGGGWR